MPRSIPGDTQSNAYDTCWSLAQAVRESQANPELDLQTGTVINRGIHSSLHRGTLPAYTGAVHPYHRSFGADVAWAVKNIYGPPVTPYSSTTSLAVLRAADLYGLRAPLLDHWDPGAPLVSRAHLPPRVAAPLP